jgi:hypothetical protein
MSADLDDFDTVEEIVDVMKASLDESFGKLGLLCLSEVLLSTTFHGPTLEHLLLNTDSTETVYLCDHLHPAPTPGTSEERFGACLCCRLQQ